MIFSFQLLIASSDEFVKCLRRGIAMVVTINHYLRAQRAAAQAVYSFQGELLVTAGFAGLNFQSSLNPVQKTERAAHVAGSAHAYSEEVTALRDQTESFIESCYPVDLA
jgi:hypothetical protein